MTAGRILRKLVIVRSHSFREARPSSGGFCYFWGLVLRRMVDRMPVRLRPATCSLIQKLIRVERLCRNGGLTHASVCLCLPFSIACGGQLEGDDNTMPGTTQEARPKKSYPRLPARIEDALILQPRIMEGEATPAEVQEYQRIINVLRGKFRNGSLSPENARRLGIE